MSASLTRRREFRVVAALVLVTALSVAGGCTQADTVVSVRVRGTVEDVQQLQVTLTIAGMMRTLMIPDPPRAIELPTSFTVQLARSLTGRLAVTVDALDGGGNTIARGNSALNNVAVGQTNQVQIDLTPGGGGSDGGAPDGGDAGMPMDTAGTGGAGTGGAGTGGMPGAGGGGGGGMGGVSGTGGAGIGGMAAGGAGAGTGGAATGGAGTGGEGTGGAGTGGAATGGAGTGGAGTGGTATGGAGGEGGGGGDGN